MAPARERPQVRVVFAGQGRLIRVSTTWRLAPALTLELTSCRVNVPSVLGRSNSHPKYASPLPREYYSHLRTFPRRSHLHLRARPGGYLSVLRNGRRHRVFSPRSEEHTSEL